MQKQQQREYIVSMIVDRKYCKTTKQYLYKVQWEGYSSDQNTWEPLSNLDNCIKLVKKFNLRERQQRYNSSQDESMLVIQPDQNRNIKPIGILAIREDQCWLSWPKIHCQKANPTIVSYEQAKQKYPQLVLEWQLYKQLKLIPQQNDKGINGNLAQHIQLCVFDYDGLQCLMKWNYDNEYNVDPNLSWIDADSVECELLLEYLESQSIQLK